MIIIYSIKYFIQKKIERKQTCERAKIKKALPTS